MTSGQRGRFRANPEVFAGALGMVERALCEFRTHRIRANEL